MTGISFSVDGHTLATAGEDGALKLWNIAPLTQPWSKLAKGACVNLLGAEQRSFSQTEIDADSLLGSLWNDVDRDVCAGVSGVPAINDSRRVARLLPGRTPKE